jgi:hypothetical protein
MDNPLIQFAKPKDGKEASFTYKGVEHRLRAQPCGDDYFAVLYPDAREAFQECSHMATVNNRIVGGKLTAYPVGIYPDVQAIVRSYAVPEGASPLDPSTVYALYDHEPGLFAQLRGHALIVLGIMEDLAVNSGKGAWEEAFALAKKAEKAAKRGEDASGLIRQIRQKAALALKDFRIGGESESDDPDDLDGAMEGLEGN